MIARYRAVVRERPAGLGLGQDEEANGVERAVRRVPVVHAKEDAARRAIDQDRRGERGPLCQQGVVVANGDHEQPVRPDLRVHRPQSRRDVGVVEEAGDRVVARDDDVELALDRGEVAEVGDREGDARAGARRLCPGSLDRALADVGARHAVAPERQPDRLRPDAARGVEDGPRAGAASRMMRRAPSPAARPPRPIGRDRRGGSRRRGRRRSRPPTSAVSPRLESAIERRSRTSA